MNILYFNRGMAMYMERRKTYKYIKIFKFVSSRIKITSQESVFYDWDFLVWCDFQLQF